MQKHKKRSHDAATAFLRERLGERATVTVLGVEYDLDAEISVRSDDEDELINELPERFLFWRRILSLCRKKVNKLKDELDELEGLRFIQYVDQAGEDGRRWSDAYIRGCIACDSRAVTFRKTFRAARNELEIALAICDAMEYRRTAIIQRGVRHTHS